MKGNEKESVQRMNMRVGVSAVAPLLPALRAAPRLRRRKAVTTVGAGGAASWVLEAVPT